MNHNVYSLPRVACAVFLTWLVPAILFSSPSFAENRRVQQKAPPRKHVDSQRLLPRKAPTSDIIIIGKAVCPLKREVRIPFSGILKKLNVQTGQIVSKGDILASYSLTIESRISLNHQLKRLNPKKEEMELLEARLGVPLDSDHIPDEIPIRAPIAGRVIRVESKVRPGARIEPSDRMFEVGVMKPMSVRAHVYEEEALRLEIGDQATVQPESRPGWKQKGGVSRISWTPLSLDPLKPSYYEVEFEVENKDLILREGMRVIIHLFKKIQRKRGES